MNRTGIVLDPRFLEHKIAHFSKENPERLRSLNGTILQRYKGRLVSVAAREADLDTIERVHSSFYLNQVREHSVSPNPYSYDRDTYLMEMSLATAQLAAGGCLELAGRILSGELDQGFAMIRPPGHHAEPGRGMGFCILNNVAIAARYLLDHYQLNRILIVDFDIHHGNGTQEAFYDTNRVLYLSLHQNSIFPFTGAASETGADKGRGYTINVPVHSYFGDEEFIYLLGRLLQSVAEQFLPEIILVSAGYDGHVDDPISATILTDHGFHIMTTLLKQCARDVCDGRLLLILEGGYNPVSLETSVLASLDSLVQQEVPRVGIPPSERAAAIFTDHPLNAFWTL